MKPISEKNIKPLKKIKALKKEKKDAAQSVKPAARIQELKNKLIILGHELFATKKIHQSLYRKLQLITYSRTTEQKLKDSYKTLKDIDNNIKQSDASQDKQKGAPKPKKITVKAFTENKKIVDEDSEAAAVKARWLGNFCPCQPVHRALKRQQQPRPLSAAPGSSALNRPGPAREFQVRSSGPPGLFRSGPPAQDNMPQPGLAPLPRIRERPASQDHQPRTGSTCNIHAPSPLRRVLRSSTGRPRTGV